jgi:hypothetical protein
MSTETPAEVHDVKRAVNPGMASAANAQGGSVNWAQFFEDNGWVDGDKIHCPDELIFEMRFVDGFSLVVYPASGAEGHELAPHIIHGVLTFKNGTDHFFYPWGMLASLVTKLNPRRTKKVQGREYAVDSGADHERRIRNSADLVIEPPASERPKTVVGQTIAQQPEVPGRRQHSAIDPSAPSWSAGGKETDD